MIYLVDTNILLRLTDRSSPLNQQVRTALRSLHNAGHTFQTTPQNCTEFWNVVTRPANQNGFGVTPDKAALLLRLIERLFALLLETPALYSEWRRLVIDFSVSGVQVHDARLVAAMNIYNIKHILTFNTADFTRYAPEGIVATDPSTVSP